MLHCVTVSHVYALAPHRTYKYATSTIAQANTKRNFIRFSLSKKSPFLNKLPFSFPYSLLLQILYVHELMILTSKETIFSNKSIGATWKLNEKFCTQRKRKKYQKIYENLAVCEELTQIQKILLGKVRFSYMTRRASFTWPFIVKGVRSEWKIALLVVK